MKHLLLTTIAAVVLVGCGGPSIQQAAETGNIEAVKQHLAAGVDVNASNFAGWTPLHRAANKGHTEIIQLLIANGADVNAKDKYGSTPLARAIQYKKHKTAALLRKHGGRTKQEIDKGVPHLYLFYGRDQLSIYGEVGLKFDVRYSSDLKEWKVLNTVTLESSPQIYLDQSTEEQPMRFYQLRLVE